MMTMLEYYTMTLKECGELLDKVVKQGRAVKRVWNSDTYRNNDLINYKGDLFQVDFLLGIVDINNTKKDLPL